MSLTTCPDFIAGEWRSVAGGTPVFNPSTGEVIAECPGGGADDVNAAVEAAAAAFPEWRDTPVVERARVMFRYRQLVEENFDRLCATVSREHGKTLAEARGQSCFAGLENIEYACGAPSLLMGDSLENIARGVDCETLLQPLGVCVGITPFNFPAMVPLWMFPLALVCGNTFVLKPSEKVPLTAVALVELLEKAGLPKGVLNLVHGGRECVDALLTHPKVRAISFVGSTPVARHIWETGDAPREARAGQWRGEELHRGDARRGRREDGREPEHGGLRLRGRALHGGLHRARGRGRGGARAARRWSRRRGRSASGRRIARRSRTWGR